MKNLVLLLFVMLSIPVTAQNIFSPGYIVTSEGDTLRGFIFEKSDSEMSRRLIFKTSENAEIRKHSVKSITGFGFDSGREFQRKAMLSKTGKNEDSTYIFAKHVLGGQTDVFIARHFQKKYPEIFLENNSNHTSLHVYRSRDDLDQEKFLNIYHNDPGTLKNPQGVRFREKILLKNIAARNQIRSSDFPVSVYRENIESDWIFVAGLPIDYSKEAIHFRGAMYLSKTRTERTSNISSIHGIIYHHWERKDLATIGTHQYGVITDKWQMINVMPIGIKIGDNQGDFRPYGYLGAGVALLRERNISFEDIHENGGDVNWLFLPTFNMGIGIKTRLGKNFLVTELTPTVNNLILNIGLSI